MTLAAKHLLAQASRLLSVDLDRQPDVWGEGKRVCCGPPSVQTWVSIVCRWCVCKLVFANGWGDLDKAGIQMDPCSTPLMCISMHMFQMVGGILFYLHVD